MPGSADLPTELAMMLPKGIVANNSLIYADVARYDHLPLEKIHEHWLVYTTTHRRLKDPTAHRLENFWWHIWGSDRRHLSGPLLATLYKEISEGPMFTPFQRPSNSHEGPTKPPSIVQTDVEDEEGNEAGEGGEARKPIREPSPASSADHEENSKPQESAASAGNHRPSTLKPPPVHSILKKPRGPSASGPRPTARFVSPQQSEDEEEVRKGDLSSGSTATNGSEKGKAPKKKSERKAHIGSGKKFVASSTSSKRRPILSRRQSSQSSASDAGTTASAGHRHLATLSTVATVAHQDDDDTETTTPGLGPETGISIGTKSPSKRSVSPLAKDSPASHDYRGQNKPVVVQQDQQPVVSARSTSQNAKQPPTPVKAEHRTRHSAGPSTAMPPSPPPGPLAAPKMGRSHSHQPSLGRREGSSGGWFLPGNTAASTVVASTSQVAATGTFEEAVTPSLSSGTAISSKRLSREVAEHHQPVVASFASPNSTSVTNTNTDTPFIRSKSQLNMLLERDKSHHHHHAEQKGKSGGASHHQK